MDNLLKLKKKEIYINKDLSVNLNEQTIFLADGGEGLHLWEAAVVLSRYAVTHSSLFDNKTILELGTGCGLLGICLLLKTNCSKLTFSDYVDSVISNLKDNISLNIRTKDKYDILQLDWREYEKLTEKYDVIIGTELIYQGGYIEELAKLIKKSLKDNGKCYISMPLQRSMTLKFIEYCNENGLKVNGECFNDFGDENLFCNVLKDEKENKKLFENLKNMKIMLYTIEHNLFIEGK